MDTMSRWNDLYGVTLSDEAQSIFSGYVDSGDYVIFQSLVDHPRVQDVEAFAACSVVFQRGDIFFSNGRQDLFLRSYFHNAKSEREFVNFAPSGGLHLSFETDTIWYPLEVTELNKEPTTVVLNIMASDPLADRELPEGFQVQRRGRMQHGLETYQVTRLTATFPGGERVPDVRLRF